MAIQVNPPPINKLPEKIKKDKELNTFFRHLNHMLLQLWKRTGGGEDLIDSTEQGLTSNSSRVSRNAARIDSLEDTSFTVENIIADFTTSRNQIINCNNTALITVTLDPQALEEDQVHIKRNNVVVDVLGLIDGKQDRRINIKNFSLHLAFNGADWSQI